MAQPSLPLTSTVMDYSWAARGQPLFITAGFISHNGSAIIAAGGGNIIAAGGGNLIAKAEPVWRRSPPSAP